MSPVVPICELLEEPLKNNHNVMKNLKNLWQTVSDSRPVWVNSDVRSFSAESKKELGLKLMVEFFGDFCDVK